MYYWYFLEVPSKFQPELCNCCHDLMQEAPSCNDVIVVSVEGNDDRIHFWYITKDEAVNLLQNADLNINFTNIKALFWMEI